MKKFLAVGSVALLCVSCADPNVKTFKSPEAGFRMQYPVDWSVKTDMPFIFVAFLVPKEEADKDLPESVMLEVQQVTEEISTVDKYWKKYEGIIKGDPTNVTKILESGPVKIGGQDGHRIVCSGLKKNIPVKFTQAWTIKDGLAYFFTYGAKTDRFETFLPRAEKIIYSTKFFKAKPSKKPSPKIRTL